MLYQPGKKNVFIYASRTRLFLLFLLCTLIFLVVLVSINQKLVKLQTNLFITFCTGLGLLLLVFALLRISYRFFKGNKMPLVIIGSAGITLYAGFSSPKGLVPWRLISQVKIEKIAINWAFSFGIKRKYLVIVVPDVAQFNAIVKLFIMFNQWTSGTKAIYIPTFLMSSCVEELLFKLFACEHKMCVSSKPEKSPHYHL